MDPNDNRLQYLCKSVSSVSRREIPHFFPRLVGLSVEWIQTVTVSGICGNLSICEQQPFLTDFTEWVPISGCHQGRVSGL